MARLRMIAGPNGSGKTVLTRDLRDNHQLNFGYYINADAIEDILRTNLKISFRRFGLRIDAETFTDFYQAHALRDRAGATFIIRGNTFYLSEPLPPPNQTYFPTLFSDFLYRKLIPQQKTFSFETVMSDKGKLALLEQAKASGYRIYLYYICTEDAVINIDRVADRVKKNGHDVLTDKIPKRYKKSLENLLAIKLSDRAFLFDNSGTQHQLVKNGNEIDFDPAFVPNWFDK